MSRRSWLPALDRVVRAAVRAAGGWGGTSPSGTLPRGTVPDDGTVPDGGPVPDGRPAPRGRPRPSAPPTGGAYAGDHVGPVDAVYAPDLDGDPDPGEIVWTWVPYEEDHSRGKDRPVLLVGRDGPWLLGLMLTSRDRDGRPNPRGERWLDLGTGDWDHERRPSEVRLDRVVRVDPGAVRREGAVLDRARFDRVVSALG